MTRFRPAVRWLVRHPTVGAVVVFGVFMAGGFNAVQSLVADNEDLVRDFKAQQCVTDWERVSDVRRAIPIPGETIIAVSPGVDPERVAQFRDLVDARIREAYPNPGCDLEAARRRLAD